MTRFWLIRHGSHDWLGKALVGRQPGVLLNRQGQQEAAKVAEALSSRPIAALYMSPLERTQQTGAPLAARMHLPIGIEEELNEIDFGEWCGLTFDELSTDPRWRRWNEARAAARAPGGERMRDVQRRIVRFLEGQSHRHAGEEIAVVGHGDVIRAALAHYLGMSLDLIQTIGFEPGAVALLELRSHSAGLLCLCSNDSLAAEFGPNAVPWFEGCPVAA
jgi:broad specificity phosphatase PhoE